MTAIDQVKARVRAFGLSTAVADAIAAAIAAAGLVLVPAAGSAVTLTAAASVLRRRVPGSGRLGSVQICSVAIGTAGWMVWRESWSAAGGGVGGSLDRSAMIFLAGDGVSEISALAALTGAGDDVASAAVTAGLSQADADAGVAMIAASGYDLQPSGGGTIEPPIPEASVERRRVPGTGETMQLVAVEMGSAGWALWIEERVGTGEPRLGELAVVRRPSGYSGGAFDAEPM